MMLEHYMVSNYNVICHVLDELIELLFSLPSVNESQLIKNHNSYIKSIDD